MTTPASPGVGTRQSTTNHESLRRDGDSEGLKDVVKEGVLYEQRDVFVGYVIIISPTIIADSTVRSLSVLT